MINDDWKLAENYTVPQEDKRATNWYAEIKTIQEQGEAAREIQRAIQALTKRFIETKDIRYLELLHAAADKIKEHRGDNNTP